MRRFHLPAFFRCIGFICIPGNAAKRIPFILSWSRAQAGTLRIRFVCVERPFVLIGCQLNGPSAFGIRESKKPFTIVLSALWAALNSRDGPHFSRPCSSLNFCRYLHAARLTRARVIQLPAVVLL